MASKLTPEQAIASDAKTLANLRLTQVRDDGAIDIDFARKAKKGLHEPTPEHIEQVKQWRDQTEGARIPSREDMLKSMRERASAQRAKEANLSKGARQGGEWAKDISTFNKINGALTLVGAGMSAVGAMSGFRTAFAADPETGKNQVRWDSLGFAMLNTAFAVGLGYLSYHCFKGTNTGVAI